MSTNCVFIAVYNGTKALAVHTPVMGNYDQLYLNIYNNGIKSPMIFRQANNSLIGILHDDNDFNIMLVTSGGQMDEKIMGDFLQSIRGKFLSQYAAQWKTAEHLQFQDSFKPYLEEIQRQIERGTRAKIAQIKTNLDDTVVKMKDNLREAILRGEVIEELDEDAQEVETKSTEFNKQSTKLKKYFWWNRFKFWILIGVGVLIILYLLLVIGCGGFDLKPRCRSSPEVKPTPTPAPEPENLVNNK
ncbi:Synaptobrevin family protein [Histomonas meleagridis]|uniref:Synaptobrevin family protein n=1 Tax=Histomonas meleagridis TaxID=135588 RepID=UPI00355A4461|nr:Synaptobrevin family protein [Histomonas meleagridis]KAH0800574.1 Synaptobrevin family protein [Histomonas meleagridis]